MLKRKKRFLDFCDPILLSELQDYYHKRDLDDGTNWQNIFNELYVSEKKLSYEKILYKHYITESSLKRFIKKTNTLAEKL